MCGFIKTNQEKNDKELIYIVTYVIDTVCADGKWKVRTHINSNPEFYELVFERTYDNDFNLIINNCGNNIKRNLLNAYCDSINPKKENLDSEDSQMYLLLNNVFISYIIMKADYMEFSKVRDNEEQKSKAVIRWNTENMENLFSHELLENFNNIKDYAVKKKKRSDAVMSINQKTYVKL